MKYYIALGLLLSLFLFRAHETLALTLPPGSQIRELSGATQWLNSSPVSLKDLHGKVVVIDFYTSRCSNCLAAVPHVVELYNKYRSKGLVVIGVHTPEMDSERELSTVQSTAKRLGITYPIAIDNKSAIWNAYGNRYWPNILIFNKDGKLVYEHAGEGSYAEIDKVVGGLLVETAPKLQTATFAAGCFWHVEDTFEHIKGVKSAVSGYTGGTTAKPSYEQVCTGATHHAEAVEVTYDPSQVSYGELLNVFWASHDPTTLNAQGPDHGEQYRSAIFYHTPEQKEAALASEKKLIASGKVNGKIVTQIDPAGPFYKAEDYHQDYFAKHGGGFCGLHF